jgi:hypothetical protein
MVNKMNPYEVEINPENFKSEEYPITLEVFNELIELHQECVYDFLHYAIETNQLVSINAYTEQWGLPDELEVLLGEFLTIPKDSKNQEGYTDPREIFKMLRKELTKYSYSFNQEKFIGEYDTIEDALAHAKIRAETFGLYIGDSITIYVGKNVYPFDLLEKYFNTDRLVDQLDDIVYDEIPFEDGGFFTLSEDNQQELREMILSYIKKHAEYPKYFTVEYITQYSHTIKG